MVFSLKFWLFGLSLLSLYSSDKVRGAPVHNFRDAQFDREDAPVNDVNYEDMIEFGRSNIVNDASEKRSHYGKKRESTPPKEVILEKRMFYGKKGGRSMVREESALDKRFAYEDGRQFVPNDAKEKRFVYYKRESKAPKEGTLEKRMFYGKKGRRSMVPIESALDERFAYEKERPSTLRSIEDDFAKTDVDLSR